MGKRIKRWVQGTFRVKRKRTFIEIGAHRGQDTQWMAAIPGVLMHAFEPDRRNELPSLDNVTFHRKAIASHDGHCPFILSERDVDWGIETGSSSIRKPAAHLTIHPTTRFVATIEVECVTLDSFIKEWNIKRIDFNWTDAQGAEGDIIDGGAEAFGITKWWWTEYSNDEQYEGQIGLDEILRRLGRSWRVAMLLPRDVLLENTRL